MENRIDLVELLKYCQQGMELECSLIEGLEFDSIVDNEYLPIRCRIKNPKGGYNVYNFTKYGCWFDTTFAKCVIFPKGKTTWKGFVPPCQFKDGDIIATKLGSIFILKKSLFADTYSCYVALTFESKFIYKEQEFGYKDMCRLATEEEKQKLFNTIKANGYKWNAKTKTLYKLIDPKFKVGDRIKNGKDIATIVGIYEDFYDIRFDSGGGFRGGEIGAFTIDQQDEWELFPNKFDINTLVPFESKVLVRSGDSLGEWIPAIFGIYRSKYNNFYVVGGTCWKHCIPYEGNEHLLGTTNDCDEYFKSWNS